MTELDEALAEFRAACWRRGGTHNNALRLYARGMAEVDAGLRERGLLGVGWYSVSGRKMAVRWT